MTDQLAECVEQIRVAFNSTPNVIRPQQRLKPVKAVQSPRQMRKVIENHCTGFYGLWSPRSKRFVFGIQEESRELAAERAKRRLGKRWKYDFEIRKIRYRNASDFHNGLRRKEHDRARVTSD